MEIKNSEEWATQKFIKIMDMLNKHNDEDLFDDFNKTITELIEMREESNTLANDQNIYTIMKNLKQELSKSGDIEIFEPFVYLDENHNRIVLTSKRDLTLIQFMITLKHVCEAF